MCYLFRDFEWSAGKFFFVYEHLGNIIGGKVGEYYRHYREREFER